jgi:hypothetical protein
MADDVWAMVGEMFNLDPFTLLRLRREWERGDALYVVGVLRGAAS